MPELDRDADITNEMPEDAFAHQAGLAWKELNMALHEIMRDEKNA
jgi:hypothetical protein